jgi:hypothetical protein
VGTGTAIELPFQPVEVVAVPLKVILLVPWVGPKPVPVIVTDVPTTPDVGERPVMFGATAKFTPLLATPPTVTTTLPAAAPVGTGTMIDLAPQLVGAAAVPSKVTVLVPWLAPKLVPVMVIVAPTAPFVGEIPVTFGTTVKPFPLLGSPPIVTSTFPLVAAGGTGTAIEVFAQLVGVAVTPLKVTIAL